MLFTTEELTLHDANALLAEEGFRGVMRLDGVRKVERVPVLGDGEDRLQSAAGDAGMR